MAVDLEDDEEAIFSDLSAEVEADGVRLAVAIYRRADELVWTLEVVNAFGTVSLAESRFLSPDEAWAAFETILDAEGPGAFLTAEQRRRALH